jgi:hypothetical protein
MPSVLLDAFGVVVIGRNEGERLKICLRSACKAAQTIYVDSGSNDGSAQWAKEFGVDVVELDTTAPFTAARARNFGFRRLRELAPDLKYVQFVDGDCQLDSTWPAAAISLLRSNDRICAVLGRRRERYPERSIYNRMCDEEWDIPVGEVASFGGDVMMQVAAFEASGGYRDELIAGEEPELCIRLKRAGWKVWRLDNEMTLHDAAILHFSQWWQRQVRSGYAFAEGAYLHGAGPERHWIWESRRAMIWGIGFPLLTIGALIIFTPVIASVICLLYPIQLFRRVASIGGPWRWRLQFSFFEQLSRFPEALGVLRFARDRFLTRRSRLIEYK